MSFESLKENKNNKKHVIIYLLIIMTLSVFIISLGLGRHSIPIIQTTKILLSKVIPIDATWTNKMSNIILNIRLPRVLGAALVGAALALSGATYQGMFKNPLVSPDLLGVSAGACVGASIAILNNYGIFGIQALALVTGLVSVLITTTIPKLFRNNTNIMLVLSGVIVSGFMGSIQGIIKYIADPEDQLASIIYWTMGSLSSVKISDIKIIAPAMILAATVLLLLRWRLNLLSLGDNEAKSLGMNIKQIRRLTILCSTVLTACAVSISGAIGWVGLIIPHLGRLLVGQDNKYLLPSSLFIGASFMIIVDTFARNLSNSEIPLSILTGLIGTPIFVWLLSRQRRG